MKLCWSSIWVERVEANAFCSGGRDRTAAAQLDKWELQGCANVNSSFSSNIFCQFLNGSPSDVIGCSPERRYDHRSMGRKWIGGNIFPSSFQIGQAGEPANVEIGWKRQSNKKTANLFSCSGQLNRWRSHSQFSRCLSTIVIASQEISFVNE